MDWTKIHAQALKHACTHYSNADPNHQHAFANSVTYLVTGASGGLHGPSLREHLVSWSLMGAGGKIGNVAGITAIYPDGSLPCAGEWEIESAYQFASPLCFDPPENHLDKLIEIAGQEYCFDDAEVDIVALKKR